MALARLRIVFIDVAQRLQNITAWFREVCGDLYELPSSMRQTVSEQNLRAVAQFGCIARERIAHLQGPGEIGSTVFEHIAQIFAGVLAAGEVERNFASWLCGHDAAGEYAGAVVGWLARHAQHAHAGV